MIDEPIPRQAPGQRPHPPRTRSRRLLAAWPVGPYQWGVRDCLTVTDACFRAAGRPPPDWGSWHEETEAAAIKKARLLFSAPAYGILHYCRSAGALEVAAPMEAGDVVLMRRVRTRAGPVSGAAIAWVGADGRPYAWEVGGLVPLESGQAMLILRVPCPPAVSPDAPAGAAMPS